MRRKQDKEHHEVDTQARWHMRLPIDQTTEEVPTILACSIHFLITDPPDLQYCPQNTAHRFRHRSTDPALAYAITP